MWGATGWRRLFNAAFGGQISWLLPAALDPAGRRAVAHPPRRRAPTAPAPRSLLWGGWLVVTGLVFSFMAGHHPRLLHGRPGAGDRRAGRHRRRRCCGSAATTSRPRADARRRRRGHRGAGRPRCSAAAPTGTRGCARSCSSPGCRGARVCCSPATDSAGACRRRRGRGRARRGAGRPRGLHASRPRPPPHDGAIPSAGPAVAGGRGGPGGGGFGAARASRAARFARHAMPGAAGGTATAPACRGGTGARAAAPARRRRQRPGGGVGGGPGGLLRRQRPRRPSWSRCSTRTPAPYTWVAATVGSNNAAGYQLATGEPVMAIGGFNGSDPSPTLAQFQQYVAEGKIHYFIAGGGGFGGPDGRQPTARSRSPPGCRRTSPRTTRRRRHRLRPDGGVR